MVTTPPPANSEISDAELSHGDHASTAVSTSDDPSSPDDDLEEERARVGQLIGERYRVTELIGLGGMGAVYAAEHIHMRKQVALKILHSEMTAVPQVVARFEREAIAAGRIEHPNVVRALDFGQLTEGAFYLVLEYVEGRTLSELLGDELCLDVPTALSAALQIALALEAAHAEGIVHRDLKPENVMLVPRDKEGALIKVLDFGIAKLTLNSPGERTEDAITKAGLVFGTPEYMSPEQATGQSVDERGDIYALGLLLFRMLAGHTAFRGDTVNATLMKQITQPMPELPRHVPRCVKNLLGTLLEKAPGDRIQTAVLVKAALLKVSAELGTRAQLPSYSEIEAGPIPSDNGPTELDSRGRVRAGLTLDARLDSSVLGHRVSFLGNTIPLWRFLLFGGVLAVLGWLLFQLLATPPAPVAEAASPAPVAEEPVDTKEAAEPVTEPGLAAIIARALAGDQRATRQLEARKTEQRGVQEWLALAQLYAQSGRFEESLGAYRRVLQAEPALATDIALRKNVARAIRQPPAAEQAAQLAADYLGSFGADLLYFVWVQTKEITALTKMAKRLLYEPGLTSQASPALTFLLQWRGAINCADYRRLLLRAAVSADDRAVTLLERANEADCELGDEELGVAQQAAQTRSAPVVYQ